MADWLDVAGRCGEGRPAVERMQRYVLACQILGYEHPDLTSHSSQVHDWYDSEDGLDLRALDRDCVELRSAADAVDHALQTQRDQVAELATAWGGSGADTAVRFLQRHCDTANAVAAEVRATAQRLESLRDSLWHLLDAKVAMTIAIDDRTLVQRPAWSAATEVVTTGVGDRQTADEVVNQQIKPYVDNEIRGDWLAAMRSAHAGIAAAYDMVIDRLAAVSRAHFEIPADLLPCSSPPTVPAGPSPRAIPPAPPNSTPPATVLPPSKLGVPADDAVAAPSGADGAGGLGDLAGLNDLGGTSGSAGLGGIGALASQIVAAIGNLLDSTAEHLTDSLAPDASWDAEDSCAQDDVGNELDGVDKKRDCDLKKTDGVEDAVGSQPAAAAPLDDPPAVAVPFAEPTEGAPPSDDPPAAAASPAEPTQGAPPLDDPPAVTPSLNHPPAAAVPPAEPTEGGPPVSDRTAGGPTPCEIAADEVPQAGQ